MDSVLLMLVYMIGVKINNEVILMLFDMKVIELSVGFIGNCGVNNGKLVLMLFEIVKVNGMVIGVVMIMCVMYVMFVVMYVYVCYCDVENDIVV